MKLLDLLAQQAEAYGVRRMAGWVERLEKSAGQFLAHWNGGEWTAGRVIMATGLVDKRPPVPRLSEAVAEGLVRYAMGSRHQTSGLRSSVMRPTLAARRFLRTYSNAVTLLTPDGSVPEANACEELDKAGVTRPSTSVASIEHREGAVRVMLTKGEQITFDTLYSVLGCEVRSQLATALGASANDVGCLIVDRNQETTVPGLIRLAM